MRRVARSLVLGLSIPMALVCSACGGNAPREQGRDLSTADLEQTREVERSSPVNSGQQELAALAINTLAAHLSVQPGEITLQSIEPVDWPDTSLGCPQPGMGYLQVITPGHKALLQYEGSVYPVHMAGSRAFVCVNKNLDAPKMPVPVLRLSAEHIGRLAAADLARRLGVQAGDVRVVSTRPVVWTDSSLGCPDGSQQYEPAQTEGFVVELEMRGRLYEYHSGPEQLIPCPPIETR